jgi:hypothetical protein
LPGRCCPDVENNKRKLRTGRSTVITRIPSTDTGKEPDKGLKRLGNFDIVAIASTGS